MLWSGWGRGRSCPPPEVAGFANEDKTPPPKRKRPTTKYHMQTFLIWLTNLRENTSTDPSSYDQVFQQQLDMIKDKVPDQTYAHLKNLNWGNYIASQLRKANFHDDDHLQHIVTKLLVQPGNLFRGYNPDKHGPLDKRFGASVRNEIAKLIQKAQNRRKYLPSVPLASHDRATSQDQSQAFLRDEIMEKVGELGVAVYDCILAGVCPSVLVGRVEFGAPSFYRVQKVRREVGELLTKEDRH